ncbi:hypothetical protein GCM10008018_26730 [Paenibacillus marchantiophytorum]|uniref:Oligopeptide/dipeptide ABC transporter C-terminal domain-containing protein n=1 Tax=Paenibacillus marchantiophytorum TaxID=1619310 RepID=A0ABQ1ENP3_9BACL|nr:hypothetical protein [Paenibacillus marchantiophytorum]GFZ79808.1 hypothetical protein GCM10008018_26730 [Paenibacillus marchantiophytorum]
MKDGVIREMGETGAVLSDPKSDYTKALLNAVSFAPTEFYVV